tara:strand:- start:11399 stop:12193 length:795 start_codon:yes stop_codon:yes gene_type:complete
MKTIQEQYQQDGYYLAKSVFNENFIKNLLDHLSTLTPKVTLPFTNVPWGYGNLVDEGPFTQIATDSNVTDFCKNVLGDKYTFNHLFVHNKAPFVGASIEWHQEVFNIDSYAPGYSKDDWKGFLQIYIALEKQDLDNGCLRIFPGSHKEGFLPHEDAINEHFSHKRRVPFDVLQDLEKKYGLHNCELNPGDVLFFNHLLVHGSASNASSRSRKAIVLQGRSDIKEKNDEIFEKESQYRTNFVIDGLTDRINSLSKKNIYLDSNKK